MKFEAEFYKFFYGKGKILLTDIALILVGKRLKLWIDPILTMFYIRELTFNESMLTIPYSTILSNRINSFDGRLIISYRTQTGLKKVIELNVIEGLTDVRFVWNPIKYDKTILKNNQKLLVHLEENLTLAKTQII